MAKGACETSYQKHEIIERLARGQLARACLFLNPRDRTLIIDMHAGDGRGVDQPQADLFGGTESVPTSLLAVSLGEALERAGINVDVYLCERSHARREQLRRVFGDRAEIVGNHEKLPPFAGCGYQWGLVLNDPNGPSDHGDETLQRIAREVARADFLININVGAINRINGLTGYSTNKAAPAYVGDPARVEALQRKYGWRTHGRQWMALLGRRHVLIPNWSYGTGSMRGSVILVTNAPQRTPKGYMRISEFTDRQETTDARRPLRRAHEGPSDTRRPHRTG